MLHKLAFLCVNYILIDITLAFWGIPGKTLFFDSSSTYIFSVSSRKSVDCSQSSSMVQQYGFHGGNNQQFKIHVDSSYFSGLHYENSQGNLVPLYYYKYHIQCKDDNDFWDRGNTFDYDNVDHEPSCGSTNACLWEFSYCHGANKHAQYIIKNKHDDYVLDVPGGSSADKVHLQVYHESHGRDNQIFLVIPKQEYACPFSVLGVDHGSGPDGKYFNFDKNTVSDILGTSLGNDVVFKVYNYRTFEIRKVKVWNVPNGGSAGDAHGRIETYDHAEAGDWETGDVLTFVGETAACASKSITVQCPFSVLDTFHTNGKTGGYFRFDLDTVEDILGHALTYGSNFDVRNLRDNSVKRVIMWNDNNGGRGIGSGHGRIDPLPSNYNYWKVGDVLVFEGVSTKCMQSFVNQADTSKC